MDINSFVIGLAKGKKSGTGFYSTKENDAGGLTYAFKAKESEGGGSMEGFHMVRFFNDDRTTLLYTVFVPTGSNAIYAGETPISATGKPIFVGFEPLATNITADLDCYATYDDVTTLNETPWEIISQLSANGTAENYFAVGDTKMIHIEGKVGTLVVNGDYGVYIIGFNHNSAVEGEGITFGTFKDAVSGGADICLKDSQYGKQSTAGYRYFNMNHAHSTACGGWEACDLRYDILGSTNVPPLNHNSSKNNEDNAAGYDANDACTSTPVGNTLMAALPADLRAVMKPMTIYTANAGGGTASNDSGTVTATVDYLPLLSMKEIGFTGYQPNAENAKQQTYAYYSAGNSKVKSSVKWWVRSTAMYNNTGFCSVSETGEGYTNQAATSLGLAPIFKV